MKRNLRVIAALLLGAVLALQPVKSEPITVGTVVGWAIWR